MDRPPPDDLGQQERAVLGAIAANPFIGQQDIAKALGLARSTVAAHIVSLVQKGHLLGRGYVLPKGKRVVCIGGATVDRKYRARRPLIAGTSNPVDGARAFGGVARNVAENLARLGVETSLVSMLGEDEAGEAVIRHLKDLGVDGARLARTRERPTAEYVAVLAADGTLALGLADMAILDLLTPEHIERAWSHLAAADWVFADCNLSADVLSHLISRRRGARFRLAVDAVSMPKVARLPQDLPGVDLLFLNLDEARALLGEQTAGCGEAAGALVARGAGSVVLTQGVDGVLLATADGHGVIPAAPARSIDVTGAGDALIAGTLARLVAGSALAEALKAGVLVAALTTESEFSVHPDLSPHMLEAALARFAGADGTEPSGVSA